MKRIAITNILLISAALSISGCQTMDNMHLWLQDNPERVKVAAAGGLGGLLLAGHFTTAVLPAVIAGAGGALIGWRIADHLYEEEMEAHAEAIHFAAEGPTGKEFAWINPETGNTGAVVATEDIWTTENGSNDGYKIKPMGARVSIRRPGPKISVVSTAEEVARP